MEQLYDLVSDRSKLELNEYCRTEYGYIFKFDESVSEDIQMQDMIRCNEGEVVKHSKNIRDLLQIEDILKIDVGFSYIIFYISTITIDKLIDGKTEIKKSDIGNFIITGGCFTGCKFSIVTKERFKESEYVVN